MTIERLRGRPFICMTDAASSMNWKSLAKLSENRFQNIPAIPGVYFVRFSPGGRQTPLRRAGGLERSSLLYIGMTEKDLRSRLMTFWKALHDKGEPVTPHTAGNTFVKFGFRRNFFPKGLYVSWHPTRKAREEEKRLLHRYLRRYLDTPPLNLTVPRW